MVNKYGTYKIGIPRRKTRKQNIVTNRISSAWGMKGKSSCDGYLALIINQGKASFDSNSSSVTKAELGLAVLK